MLVTLFATWLESTIRRPTKRSSALIRFIT